MGGIRYTLIALLLVGPGCAVQTEPEKRLPEGGALFGEAPPLLSVLSRLEGLKGTPVARRAREVRERLEGCTHFFGSAPDGDWEHLLEALRCGAASDEIPPLRELRGDDPIALVVPFGNRGRLVGSARVSSLGSLTLSGEIEFGEEGGLTDLLISSGKPVGPASLSSSQTLLHARVRPEGGLNVAAHVRRGTQGDRLFRLRSDLFLGAVLDGTWELAVYMPTEGRAMPPVALALDFRVRDGAVTAIERLIDDLESTWPVHRAPFAVGGWRGACLPDLRVLPELGPCYVATESSLIVGWNPESVRSALRPSDALGPGGRGGWIVHLDRLGEADRRLQRALVPEVPPLQLGYGWERLQAESALERGRVRLRVELIARRPS